MNEQDVEKLLGQLADATAEPVDATLAQGIKQHIPHKLTHWSGLDTMNIIIDLRISKLAAAAAIIITMAFFVVLFAGRDTAGNGILGELKYVFAAEGLDGGGFSKAVPELYKYLAQQGKEVTYYENAMHIDVPDAIVMHWRLPDGSYGVVFANRGLKTVDADELIRLQAAMLKNKDK